MVFSGILLTEINEMVIEKIRQHSAATKGPQCMNMGGVAVLQIKLEALERLYRSTGLIFLQWQKFLTIIIQSLHFSSLKKKGMEKTCEKRRKKW